MSDVDLFLTVERDLPLFDRCCWSAGPRVRRFSVGVVEIENDAGRLGLFLERVELYAVTLLETAGAARRIDEKAVVESLSTPQSLRGIALLIQRRTLARLYADHPHLFWRDGSRTFFQDKTCVPCRNEGLWLVSDAPPFDYRILLDDETLTIEVRS